MSSLDNSSPQDSPGMPVIVTARASLVLRQIDGSARTIPLTSEPVTIGRHPTNSIVIDIATVSAGHAVIEYVDGDYRLTDRNSKNGTFVNGQRIDVTLLH